MNVRELMRILIDSDPEAEVMTSTDLSLTREKDIAGTLRFPTRDVESGTFADEQRRYVMIVSTDVWGMSPKK